MAIEVIKCPSCNGQIQVENNNEFGFCSFCGNKIRLREVIEVRHKDIGVDSGASRNNALEEMERLVDYFEETRPLYSKKEELREIYTNIYSKGKSKTFYVSGGVIIWLSLIPAMTIKEGEFPWITLFGLAIAMVCVVMGILEDKKASHKKDDINKMIAKIDKKLLDDYNNYDNCPLGFEYTNPDTLQIIYNYIRQGRAYSIKEALNLYLQEYKK